MEQSPPVTGKHGWRSAVLAARRQRPRRALVAVPLPGPRVASYVPLPDEPDPAPLTAHLERVLLPRLLPDRSLEWAWWAGEELVAGPLGTREPTGPAVGLEVDVVLVPALAVDPLTGVRLGRGGGSYDRALGSVPLAARWALLDDDSELITLLAEPHDQPVSRVITPTRARRTGRP